LDQASCSGADSWTVSANNARASNATAQAPVQVV
jgi:hypothetical protein